MSYAVYTTQRFDEEVLKLDKAEQERISKIFLQLKENPYVGDQLRYRFFREKRIKNTMRHLALNLDDYCPRWQSRIFDS